MSGSAVQIIGAALALAVAGCSPGAAPAPVAHNVVLVTVDTLRADVLGPYGSMVETPAFTQLADRGAVFDAAYTTCSVTGPSHASMFTGLHPPTHGMPGNAWRLDPALDTLATLFSRAGFATAGFVSTAVLSSESGLARGFDVYDQEFLRGVSFERTLQRRGDATVDAALAWLDARGDERYFLWLHLFDPHAPYDPPPGFWPGGRTRLDTSPAALDAIYAGTTPMDDALREQIAEQYRAEVRFADAQLGRLLTALSEPDRVDTTAIIVIADHGEELGEHMNYFEHARSLYEGVIRVPLLIAAPGLSPRRIPAAVQSVDVMPTALALAGVLVPEGLDGMSLLAHLTGRSDPPARAFVVARKPDNPRYFARGNAVAAVRGREKVIVHDQGPPEAYDLVEDPGELHDRSPSAGAASTALLADLERAEADARERGPLGRRERLGLSEQRERLRALGYAVD